MRWEGKFTLALCWFINFHRSQKSSFAKSEKSVAMFCYDFRWGIYFSSILKIDSLGGMSVILGFGLLGLLSCILRWLWMGDGFAPDRKISGGNWVNFHSPLNKSSSIEPWLGWVEKWGSTMRWGTEIKTSYPHRCSCRACLFIEYTCIKSTAVTPWLGPQKALWWSRWGSNK